MKRTSRRTRMTRKAVGMAKARPRKVLILGAGGRDFHDFNLFFRDNPAYKVVAFTATQIPGIEGRRYPAKLAGRLYPKGIPIYEEAQLQKLIEKHRIDIVVLAYSDLLHEEVMHKASAAVAVGADFWLIGQNNGQLRSRKPVIAVVATRTGAGKTTVARAVCEILRERGKRVVVVRHPMPYGDLAKQICQRFGSLDDLKRQKCTIEEMEEYSPYLEEGFVVYAGVDYAKILRAAEKEADVIVYEGGNNDFPLIRPDLQITVADPHRPGHELLSFPGEVNARAADIVVINKVNTAPRRNADIVEQNIKKVNGKAAIVKASSVLSIDRPELVRGRRIAVVEDAPTVTHGGLKGAAGYFAAQAAGATIVDPKPYAAGSVKNVIRRYDLQVIPTMGYGRKQMKELEKTINAVPCDAVLLGTQADISALIRIKKPVAKVRYRIDRIALERLKILI